jgi:hypothetical protein
MLPRYRASSNDKSPLDGCDAGPMDLPHAYQLSPPKCSQAVIAMSNVPFAGVLEASFNVTGRSFDIYTGLMQSARDCACSKAAVRQQVSRSCRTLRPILLRQIPPNHHRIEACALLKPTLRPCGLLTFACLRLICSALWGGAESTRRRRLRAPYSTEPDGSWRHPRLLRKLRTTYWPTFTIGDVDEERARSTCCGSPPIACSSAPSLRARTGVLASSIILEAGEFDSPLVHPSGLDYSVHCAASTTSLVRAPTLEPPLAHPSVPH